MKTYWKAFLTLVDACGYLVATLFCGLTAAWSEGPEEMKWWVLFVGFMVAMWIQILERKVTAELFAIREFLTVMHNEARPEKEKSE